MENNKNKEEISTILKNMSNVHYLSGPIYQSVQRIKAQDCFKTNELQAIYRLVESHVPSLRLKTVLRYEKILTSESNGQQLSGCKSHVAPSCTTSTITENVDKMLENIKEMPPEWTLVQLTPYNNAKENVEIDVDKHDTHCLYLTVFNCGKNQPKPFCVEVKPPRDVAGSFVSLRQEIHSIMNDNRNTLLLSKTQSRFEGVFEKKSYYAKREAIDDRLKLLVKDLQDLYLKEWRCFFIGKYINANLETKIQKRIKELIRAEVPSFSLDEKTLTILQYLTKSATYIKLTELKAAIQSIIPSSVNKNFVKVVAQLIRNVSTEFRLQEQKTHPLILIIDDSLDCFPWEMMDILIDKSVTRLPSLHLAYTLFQEHKETIQNGFKIVKNPHKGTYIINPDLDLQSMQNRILSFYKYWLPNWIGVAGRKPSYEEFEKMLLSGDIFAYNGHGNGSHLFSIYKLEKIRINAVVLLFGCSSTKLTVVGPQSEMFSPYHIYLIACSPCIVGNLWEVTDLDTDTLATEILSQWIPNRFKAPWKKLDKSQWKKGEKVEFTSVEPFSPQTHESELLKVLSAAKKSNLLTFYITKAGIVARGIPVKIDTQ